MDTAGIDPQPPFAGGYLPARDPARGRGGRVLMQAYWTLTRRELAGFFVSLTGYVIIAAAVFLMGLSFVVMLNNLRSEPTPEPVTQIFFATPFFWLILLLAAPVITMRLFALEKYSGT